MSDLKTVSETRNLAEWSDQLASAIDALDGGDVPSTLFAAIQILVPCDCALLLAYSRHQRPRVLFDRFDHPLRRNRLETYLQGSYLLDPFYLAAASCREPALLRLSGLAPDDFERSDYFLDYYRRSHISDELNYLIPAGRGVCLALSLERTANNAAFTTSESRKLEAILRLVAVLLRAYWKNAHVQSQADSADQEHERLVNRLERLGENVLTTREREVTQLVLKGCSNHAIADQLNLSIETIKVHRRNIYRKLNISSLAELYSYALRVLSSDQNQN